MRGVRIGSRSSFFGREIQLDRRNDRPGDLLLNSPCIVCFALNRVGPQVITIARMD
jgi:hypothetical protein